MHANVAVAVAVAISGDVVMQCVMKWVGGRGGMMTMPWNGGGQGRVHLNHERSQSTHTPALPPARILGMGNPLLDISAVVTPEYLAK
jgi:hypothetical protein